jgi:acyl carrier protein
MKKTDKADNNLDFNQEFLLNQVEQIVSEISGKKIPDTKANLASLGMDSMTMLDVLTALEDRFGIVLNESVAEEFVTLNQIARVVQDVIRTTTNEPKRKHQL